MKHNWVYVNNNTIIKQSTMSFWILNYTIIILWATNNRYMLPRTNSSKVWFYQCRFYMFDNYNWLNMIEYQFDLNNGSLNNEKVSLTRAI